MGECVPVCSGADAWPAGCGVLVTGGCGFIGSSFLHAVVPARPDVTFVCLDRMDVCASRANLDGIDHLPNLVVVEGNVANSELVCHLLARHAVHTVVHFAAQSHVCNSFAGARLFVEDNVTGTMMLCEAARRYASLERFVYISTDEVVGDGEEYKDETAPPASPNNPYAASKAAAELIALSYLRAWRLPITVVRMCNVYGPRQYPEKVVGAFCMRALLGKELPVHGAGRARRTYIYIDDAVRALVIVAQRGAPGQVAHITAPVECERTVLQVAEAVRAAFAHALPDAPAPAVRHVDDRIYNDACYHISGEVLRAQGWAASVPFERGVCTTLEWYARNVERFRGMVDGSQQ